MVILTKYQKQFQEQPQSQSKKFLAKILIIDDDVELLEEMKEGLTFYNYDVDVVADSGVAVEKVCQVKPNLILLDLKMKPKNGFQIANELQLSSSSSSIPIIAVTGYFTE